MTIVQCIDHQLHVDDTVEELRARYESGDREITLMCILQEFDTRGLNEAFEQMYITAIDRKEFCGCYDGLDGPAFWLTDPRS